jgi:hypothetical protein
VRIIPIWLFRGFVAAAAIYLFVMSLVFSFLIADFFIPAQVPISLELFESKIKPDEQLRYLATFKRNKPCRTEIQRFIVYKDKQAALEQLERRTGIPGTSITDGKETEFIGYRDTIIGIITQAGSDVVRTVSVMDHPPLPVGHYSLRIYVVSSCDLVTRLDLYPEVPFEVVE